MHRDPRPADTITTTTELDDLRPAYLTDLAASVEQFAAVRSVLRAVIALAEELPQLTDRELRARLTALAPVPTQRAGPR